MSLLFIATSQMSWLFMAMSRRIIYLQKILKMFTNVPEHDQNTQEVTIPLLSLMSKLLEKHVYIHLNDYLKKFSSLSTVLVYSCNTVLARLTNSWLTVMNISEVSGVVF